MYQHGNVSSVYGNFDGNAAGSTDNRAKYTRQPSVSSKTSSVSSGSKVLRSMKSSKSGLRDLYATPDTSQETLNSPLKSTVPTPRTMSVASTASISAILIPSTVRTASVSSVAPSTVSPLKPRKPPKRSPPNHRTAVPLVSALRASDDTTKESFSYMKPSDIANNQKFTSAVRDSAVKATVALRQQEHAGTREATFVQDQLRIKAMAPHLEIGLGALKEMTQTEQREYQNWAYRLKTADSLLDTRGRVQAAAQTAAFDICQLLTTARELQLTVTKRLAYGEGERSKAMLDAAYKQAELSWIALQKSRTQRKALPTPNANNQVTTAAVNNQFTKGSAVEAKPGLKPLVRLTPLHNPPANHPGTPLALERQRRWRRKMSTRSWTRPSVSSAWNGFLSMFSNNREDRKRHEGRGNNAQARRIAVSSEGRRYMYTHV
ncbi:hypothetical protein EMMF5_003377 [Cystobasidiomycetes sp. EMM_F5]